MEEILSDGPKAGGSGALTDVRALTQSLACYRQPNLGRSVVEILITVGPFVVLWVLACL